MFDGIVYFTTGGEPPPLRSIEHFRSTVLFVGLAHFTRGSRTSPPTNEPYVMFVPVLFDGIVCFTAYSRGRLSLQDRANNTFSAVVISTFCLWQNTSCHEVTHHNGKAVASCSRRECIMLPKGVHHAPEGSASRSPREH